MPDPSHIRSRLVRFRQREEGAVTVDWVVLTAAVIGLGLVVVNAIGGSTDSMAVRVSSQLSAINAGYGTN
ncbi:hypothetical protein [Acidimangrovimonas pyrenivorans]|uniref:Pilus assembly protein n=1 Tax=Acidimangrovimonas pyrenivorans TaxID=2030798 RepID=A0ABV7AAW9_9RHOB